MQPGRYYVLYSLTSTEFNAASMAFRMYVFGSDRKISFQESSEQQSVTELVFGNVSIHDYIPSGYLICITSTIPNAIPNIRRRYGLPRRCIQVDKLDNGHLVVTEGKHTPSLPYLLATITAYLSKMQTLGELCSVTSSVEVLILEPFRAYVFPPLLPRMAGCVIGNVLIYHSGAIHTGEADRCVVPVASCPHDLRGCSCSCSPQPGAIHPLQAGWGEVANRRRARRR